MLYTNNQLIKIVRRQIKTFYNVRKMRIVRHNRLAKMGKPRFHLNVTYRSNKRYYRYLLR